MCNRASEAELASCRLAPPPRGPRRGRALRAFWVVVATSSLSSATELTLERRLALASGFGEDGRELRLETGGGLEIVSGTACFCGELIFAGDFESGDTSAWSATIP